MKRPVFLYCIIILNVILYQPLAVCSDCNVCNALTNTSCISETEFQQCNNNTPFGNIFQCNTGYYCSILGGCATSEELSDCKQCGKCDETQTFACTGTQTFALCLGLEKPSEITGQCTKNLTCNIDNSKICGDISSTCSFRDDPVTETTTTTEATTTTTTTTPSPAQDPNGFCRLIQKSGRYPVGTNPQTTCRQYINCVKVGTTWYGPIYNCPGETYFDSSKNSCSAKRPSTCGGTIARLAFRNIPFE